ncbi:MAG: GTPase domain-containing protein [Ideonella sp.]|nr:GTPase domain-containing protein [Ideonella sp.]
MNEAPDTVADGQPQPQPRHWHLFIAAHTNVGKTALLRTLLGQDVGEVHDAPDVTQGVTAHELARDAQGQALSLWDTPGFGDSFRLAQRLRRRSAWLRWLLRECWDRWRTPALWRAQRLAQTLRTQADVVLYPVSLLETPSDAIYVAPEMEVLALVGKPVLVILNQGGALSDEAQRDTRVQQWRATLAAHAVVRSVIDLDAFSRCWLQELTLFEEIGRVLPEADQPRYQSLARQLQQAHVARFEASVAALTHCLIETARDRCELAPAQASSSGLTGTLERLRQHLPWHKEGPHGPAEQARADLAQRHAQRTQDLATRLIALHRLDGVGAAEVWALTAEAWKESAPLDPSSSSLVGGVITGVLTGLGADLMTGGLSLGAGALVGGVAGALGGAAIAGGYNVVTHQDKKLIRWSPQALEEGVAKAALLYLSVAHFGRGQGPWQQQAATGRWLAALEHTLKPQLSALQALWAEPDAVLATPQAEACLHAVLDSVLRGALLQLYPDRHAVLAQRLPLGAAPAAGTMLGDAHLRPD